MARKLGWVMITILAALCLYGIDRMEHKVKQFGQSQESALNESRPDSP